MGVGIKMVFEAMKLDEIYRRAATRKTLLSRNALEALRTFRGHREGKKPLTETETEKEEPVR